MSAIDRLVNNLNCLMEFFSTVIDEAVLDVVTPTVDYQKVLSTITADVRICEL